MSLRFSLTLDSVSRNGRRQGFMKVLNRGSQIPLSRLFHFLIPPSRPILRPNPDPVPFFLRDFLLDY